MAGETEWWDEVEKGSSNEGSALKKDLQNEELNNQRAMMRKWRDTVGAEQARTAAHEATINPDSHEGKQTYWAGVNADANHLINDNAAGWQEFPNFMTDLCHKALNMARANWYDPIDYTYFVPYRDEIGAAWVMFKDKAYDKTLAHLENAYDRNFKNIELPNIAYTAALNDQGKLEVKVTKNGEPVTKKYQADGQLDMDDIGTKLQMAFDTGAVAWGKLQGPEGYDFNPADQTFKSKADNSIMTNEQFKEYNAIPEKSLNAALNKRVDMVLKEEEVPASPAPR